MCSRSCTGFFSEPTYGARSIQPKFRPVRPGKEDHLKRWTSFFETFPVGPNRSIEFWTEISGNFGWMDRAYGLKVLFVYVYKNAFVAVQSHNFTWCQKAVLILAFVYLTTSFERQPWSTASLESDWSMPADPPNEGWQPVQAVQAPIFTSNVPVPQKIELSGNLANNWKQWKQVWSAYELVTRLNEQTDEYRVAAFITCTVCGPWSVQVRDALGQRFFRKWWNISSRKK